MASVNEYAPDEDIENYDSNGIWIDIILLEKNIILVKGHSSL